jgi:hypothetical protein
VAEEPEEVLPQQRIAHRRDVEEVVPTVRSMASITLATISGGMANTIMKAMTRIAQTKRGMRLSDIPGARCLRMVTIKLDGGHQRGETSMKVIIVAQKSMPIPGEYSGRSGARS